MKVSKTPREQMLSLVKLFNMRWCSHCNGWFTLDHFTAYIDKNILTNYKCKEYGKERYRKAHPNAQPRPIAKKEGFKWCTTCQRYFKVSDKHWLGFGKMCKIKHRFEISQYKNLPEGYEWDKIRHGIFAV
jgi:hypothetical protein